jgi:hypothetical protein
METHFQSFRESEPWTQEQFNQWFAECELLCMTPMELTTVEYRRYNRAVEEMEALQEKISERMWWAMWTKSVEPIILGIQIARRRQATAVDSIIRVRVQGKEDTAYLLSRNYDPGNYVLENGVQRT